MPDLMTIDIPDIPDISAARAEQVWSHVLATASRERARSRKRRAFGISGATTLAGALGFALLAPTSSFATWTEVPTVVRLSPADPSLTSCLTALADVKGGPHTDPVRQPLLSEQRGAFITNLLAGDGTLSICIGKGADLWTGTNIAPALPGNQTVTVLGNAGLVEPEGLRYVFGRITGEVGGVTVVTDDGLRVTASVGGGYFLAWWPGSAAPKTVMATDKSGAVLTAVTPSAG